MKDYYLRADSRAGLLADLEPLGLVVEGEFVDASHEHALAFVGEIAGVQGVHLNLRVLTDTLAEAIIGANFKHTTQVHPESPACIWAE